MTALDVLVSDLYYEINLHQNHKEGAPIYGDQSHSSNCDRLTLQMARCLLSRGLEFRREFHQDNEKYWHYVIAHAAIEATPRIDDVITDMNPWQWTTSKEYSGPLHGPRHEVMQQLLDAGAEESFVALRGIETIVTAHRMPE